MIISQKAFKLLTRLKIYPPIPMTREASRLVSMLIKYNTIQDIILFIVNLSYSKTMVTIRARRVIANRASQMRKSLLNKEYRFSRNLYPSSTSAT